MNNASQAPWWFAVVTALIAVTGTLTSAWLTNKYAEKRSHRELENQRDQFAVQLQHQRDQFKNELKHQRDLERRKLLYDRRADLYAKVMALHTECMETLPLLEMAISRYIASEDDADARQEVRTRLNDLRELRKKLRVLTLDLIVIASGKVSALANQIGHDLRFVITTTEEALKDESFHELDLQKLMSFPTRLLSKCAMSMRKDLGVVEKVVDSDKMKPTDEDLARLVSIKADDSSNVVASAGESE